MKNLILAAVAAGCFFSVAGGVAKANDNGAAVDASAYSIITNVFSITSGAECASVGTAADCTVAAFTPDRTCNSCTILETTINGDSGPHNVLIITVSAVTGIFTANLNALDYHNFQAVFDAAHINMKVKVDGRDAVPGPVIFDSMMHFDLNAGTPTFLNLDLSQEMGARSFTFFYFLPNDPNIWSSHKVEVDAWVKVDADVFTAHGFALTDMAAIIGKRTLTVTKSYLDYTHHP
jgi:hypothetical protein